MIEPAAETTSAWNSMTSVGAAIVNFFLILLFTGVIAIIGLGKIFLCD